MIKTPCQWWLWNYSLSLLSVTNLHTVAPSCVQLKRTRTRRMISVHPSTRRWRSEGSRLEWSGVPPAVSTGPHGAPTALSVTIVLRCAGTHTHTHKCYLSTVAVKFRQNLTSIDTNQLHIYQSSHLDSVLLHTKYWIRWWIFSFHCLMFTWFFFFLIDFSVGLWSPLSMGEQLYRQEELPVLFPLPSVTHGSHHGCVWLWLALYTLSSPQHRLPALDCHVSLIISLTRAHSSVEFLSANYWNLLSSEILTLGNRE